MSGFLNVGAIMSATASQLSVNTRDRSANVHPAPASPQPPTEPVVQVSAHEREMRAAIRETLQKKLELMNYDSDVCQKAAKDLSEVVKSRLKDFGLERHKIVVQVMIGEQKNQGFQLVNKCFWDSKTDLCLVEQFRGDSLFCVVVAYVLHYY